MTPHETFEAIARRVPAAEPKVSSLPSGVAMLDIVIQGCTTALSSCRNTKFMGFPELPIPHRFGMASRSPLLQRTPSNRGLWNY